MSRPPSGRSERAAGRLGAPARQIEGLTASTVAAHVDVAPRKVAGPIVVPLDIPNETTFETSGCATADPALLAAIAENPVHTPTCPGGEVRDRLK